jgi:hypothetical protein
MSYLDGVHYGKDQVSGEDYVPLEFSSAEWDGGRKILASRNEYPPPRPVNYKQLQPVADVQLTKKLIPPPGLVEYFSAVKSNVDFQFIIMMILLIMFAIQLRIMWQLEVVLRLESTRPTVKS